MKKIIRVIAFTVTAFMTFQGVVFSQAFNPASTPFSNIVYNPVYPTPTPSPTPDYEEKIREHAEELNHLEIQSELMQGKMEKEKKTLFGFAGGSFEQDFESNGLSWSILQGQTMRLRFFANPTDNVTGHLDLQLWGNVAPDYFSFNSLSTLVNNNIFFTIRELDATLDTGDFAFTAFKGWAYGGYNYSYDDFYSLLGDQWDTEKNFRIAGHAMPTGMKIKGERDFDGLEIWAGYELQWGVAQEVYFLYKNKIGPTTLGVVDRIRLQKINDNGQLWTFANGVTLNAYSPALPVTNTTAFTTSPWNTTEVFWKVPIGDWTMDNVGLYQPTTVASNYTYVQNATPGAGTGGSGYTIQQGTVTTTDALGYQLKLSSNSVPLFDSFMVSGEYDGLTAGNLERLSGEVTKVPATQCLFTFNWTVQKPLIGPNPSIPIVNSAGATLGFLLTPRGQFDPFRVTSDPISGANNREMTKFNLSFVFNPGNGWFFRWNPNDFGGYNINTDMDTPFSCGIIGTLVNYPTGTDLFSYVGPNGQLVWEGGGATGQYPTNGYQPYVTGWALWRTGLVHWIAHAEGGFSMSALSYNDSKAPSTYSHIEDLTARINNTSLMVGYGHDIWGPEDWHRQFGTIIGQQYLAKISQKFGNSVVSLKYQRWENDLNNLPIYQQFTDPITGTSGLGVPSPFDELYATYTINF